MKGDGIAQICNKFNKNVNHAVWEASRRSRCRKQVVNLDDHKDPTQQE